MRDGAAFVAALSLLSAWKVRNAMTGAQVTSPPVPSSLRRMLYDSMKHRTQLYLDESQHRWLRQRAGRSGSIAAVVRELIDAERARRPDLSADPLLRYLVDESPGRGRVDTSVTTLDRDLYGR
jgi:hypothetical protein